jgi:hypothetical protein
MDQLEFEELLNLIQNADESERAYHCCLYF